MADINESTTVRSLLQAHPATFGVFLAHGMCEDCRNDPPQVPLSHFAAKHCDGNLPGLIRELQSAIDAT